MAADRSRPPRSVWFWVLAGFVLTTLGFEVARRAWCRDLPNHLRNPGFRRGWYEYVGATPPRAPNEKVILLLSNSQGYGREVAEHETVAGRLQALLATESRTTRVVNWSLPGGQYFDFAVLAAAAQDLRPDMIILLAPSALFCSPDVPRAGTETWTTDVHQLLTRTAIRRRMQPADLSPRLSVSLWGDIILGRAWPPWRWRRRPVAWLATMPALRPLLPNEHDTTWIFPRPPGRTRGAPRAPSKRTFLAPDRTLVLAPAPAQRLLDQLQRAAPRVLLVDQPRVASWHTQPDPAWPALEELARARGIECLRLRDLVPDEEFVSATHLSAEGHDRLARRLLETRP
jgi:hypothetical protein